MPIASGKLRQRITIEHDVGTSGPGQPTPIFVPLAKRVPAEVMAVTGGEIVRGQQMQDVTAYLVNIRWRSDVTPLMHIIHGTATLSIVSVRDLDGLRRDLSIQCKQAG